MSEERTEWRVVGVPGHGYPPYAYTFDSEEAARGFVRMIADHDPWDDGPHLETRTVVETSWVRDEDVTERERSVEKGAAVVLPCCLGRGACQAPSDIGPCAPLTDVQ